MSGFSPLYFEQEFQREDFVRLNFVLKICRHTATKYFQAYSMRGNSENRFKSFHQLTSQRLSSIFRKNCVHQNQKIFEAMMLTP